MLNKLMKRKSHQPQAVTGETYYSPYVDILESDNDIQLIFDIPGADKDKINIKVEKGILYLTAEVSRYIPEKSELISAEYWIGHYSRSFTLPDYLDVDKISAAYKNGVLNVTLPKAEEVKPKTIEVKVS